MPSPKEIAESLSESMADTLRAAVYPGYRRGHVDLDVAGDGSGIHSSARALGRRGLLICAHPGGPAWGEWNLTNLGRAVAAELEKR